MAISYPTIYHDEYGEETTTIYNDGNTLSMIVRGIKFSGHNFHSFNFPEGVDNSKRQLFNLFLDELCAYSLDCEIPIWLVNNSELSQVTLHVHVEYGRPVEGLGRTVVHLKNGTTVDDNRQIDTEVLQLALVYQSKSYQSGGKHLHNTFDEQLTELKAKLPEGLYLKICWNCAYSDYLPIGSGMLGGLGCFRNVKEEYKIVKDKRGLILLWDSRAEDVQEIHLCPEFERRQPGAGGLYVG